MQNTDQPHVTNRIRQERIAHNWRQRDLAERLGTTTVSVKRWERGIQQPSAYFRIKLCTLFGKSAEELGLLNGSASLPASTEEEVSELESERSSPSETSGIWMVPYRRNLHFTGRDDLLEQLAQQFAVESSEPMTTMRQAVLSQPQAIKGLGGIGKTQIALEYAYRAREQGRYRHTFWINAANEEAILASFQAMATRLPDFAAKDEQNQDKLITAILRWLEQCSHPWLLIVDNADDLALVQPCLPVQGSGSILLTTRAHAVAALSKALEVEQMGLMEGTHFLLHRSQRLHASDEERNEASNIVIALDGFPLALDQAGAYLEETGCSFGDYLHLYERHRSRLLARRGKQMTHYPDSIATTWDLSFRQVEQTYPAAAELLRLCAYLSPDHIPEELLTENAAYWPPLLQQTVADPLSFNEMLSTLLAFSLVKRLAQKHLLSIHRLVQAVQMDRMNVQEQQRWTERVVCAVNALFPPDPEEQVDTWPQCLRFLEQVQACDQLIQQHRLCIPEAAELLNRAGIYLREHASYSLAEPLFQQALAIAEQQLGTEHLLVATSLNNLGLLYYEQGKYSEAEPLYRRALHIREQVLGPHHPWLAYNLNNLGLLYYEQGHYGQAEPLYRRALHLQEQALSPHHSWLASSLNDLGIISYKQGYYEQAEPLLQRALHVWEQALGPHHPKLALSLNNLGLLYYEQGHYEQAEPLLQRALHVWEQALGPQHPDVATSLNNLGLLYYEQGHYEQAEPLLQRSLSIREQALGPYHPWLASCLHSLGELALKQRRYEQAKSFYQRALRILEQAPSSPPPHVAHILNGLANLSREQGHYEQADELYQRVLMIRREHLGPQHSDMAETFHHLAQLRERQQQLVEALSLYQQALPIREQALGVYHPKTCETRECLRAVLDALGQAQEAVVLEKAHLDQA
jgi:tetratricopeptide (TPR) repeat protein/DNA-binding XRE family transcriptional regulator